MSRLWIPHKDENSPFYRENMIAIERHANETSTIWQNPVLFSGTSQVSVGAGSVNGWYQVKGDLCFYEVLFVFGTGFSFGVGGTLFLVLPFPKANVLGPKGSVFGNPGGASHSGEGVGDSTTNNRIFWLDHPSGNVWSNVAPGAWAVNQVLMAAGWYRMVAAPA